MIQITSQVDTNILKDVHHRIAGFDELSVHTIRNFYIFLAIH